VGFVGKLIFLKKYVEVNNTIDAVNCVYFCILLNRKAKVADMLLATIEVPSGLAIRGRSCLMQAQVFRAKKEGRGEGCAKDVSDSLPFLEYELYRRLINKLRVKGMNACFGLKVCSFYNI